MSNKNFRVYVSFVDKDGGEILSANWGTNDPNAIDLSLRPFGAVRAEVSVQDTSSKIVHKLDIAV